VDGRPGDLALLWGESGVFTCVSCLFLRQRACSGFRCLSSIILKTLSICAKIQSNRADLTTQPHTAIYQLYFLVWVGFKRYTRMSGLDVGTVVCVFLVSKCILWLRLGFGWFWWITVCSLILARFLAGGPKWGYKLNCWTVYADQWTITSQILNKFRELFATKLCGENGVANWLPSWYDMICASMLHTVNAVWWEAVLHESVQSFFYWKRFR